MVKKTTQMTCWLHCESKNSLITAAIHSWFQKLSYCKKKKKSKPDANNWIFWIIFFLSTQQLFVRINISFLFAFQ